MILEARGISFFYADFPVLRDVSFSMDAGEALCLVGPNGSGKTTLLDCVTGFLRPQQGVVSVCGKPLVDYRRPELARLVSSVPQQHYPTFPYRVRDVVMMGRTAHSGLFGGYGAEDADVCAEAMRLVGVEDLADRAYHTLSGGELKLVMLARALAQQPKLIVLDEPTASLDFQNELRFLEVLTALIRRQNISALIATHALDHAFFFERCGVPVRVALLAKNRPMRLGIPQDILTSEMIADVFGVQAQITETPSDGGTVRQISLLRTIDRDGGAV